MAHETSAAVPVSVHPASMYDELLAAPGQGAVLRRDDGHATPLDIDRWLGSSSAVDEAIAAAAEGPVLDIGCGPGRLLDALARRGEWAMGVDLSSVAVGLARGRGRHAVHGSIFDEVPGAGEWETALLMDGCIGIGGDPKALLDRVRALLRPGGTAIVEVEPPGAGTRAGKVRLEIGDRASSWFEWAHVDVNGIAALAELRELRPIAERWFAWV